VPLRAGSCDLVIAAELLEHVEQIGPVLLICYDTMWSPTRDKEFPDWLAKATAGQAKAGDVCPQPVGHAAAAHH
jgi:hypothetical protein